MLAEERRRLLSLVVAGPSRTTPALDIDNIINRYLYDASLVSTDCEHLLRSPFVPGRHMDEDRILAIKVNPRFRAWLAAGESSLLFMNANSTPSSNLEMSFVSAQVFQRAAEVSSEQRQASARSELIPLAFFCSQHQDYRRDVNGPPSELAMSLLLQLVDAYRGFRPEDLAAAFDGGDFDPKDIKSILAAFGSLVSRLPSSVIVILIVDGLRFFWHPKTRRDGTAKVVAGLVDIHHREHDAILKFLFANSTRADFLEDIFADDETLRLPTQLSVGHSYNTTRWRRPVDLES